jgi:sec-independent protein translocase protein TatB
VFNVGIGEIGVIILVCLIVFGPDRLPQMARQLGRFLGQVRLMTQGALDQLKEEADLKDINLPDLKVGTLRTQARDYVRELLDIEGQMADLEREREQIKASLEADAEPNGGIGGIGGIGGNGRNGGKEANGSVAGAAGAAGIESHGTSAFRETTGAAGKPAPVDPDAT